jgi:hypothetical protein
LVVRESCQVAIDMWEVRFLLSPSLLSFHSAHPLGSFTSITPR